MPDRTITPILNRLALVPALLLALGSPGALAVSLGGVGGTYHVAGHGDDTTGDGSEANPWRTITHAFDTSGGGAPTIIVHGGNYEADVGEEFPLQIDEYDDQGISILSAGELNTVIEGPLNNDVFEAHDYVNGLVEISGFEVRAPAEAIPPGTDHLLDLENGAATVRVLNNIIEGMGALDIDDTPDNVEALVSGNTV
ncbi:MAG: DUF1565 domain-containing protein [Planctomycetota bacterium]|jgi:hypothetical protein|nr:DUF1565 domain-containing protein [Planctomycetota bacterium]MDP6988077.1 DUF1565 domain-containing protein [Planctomycetota bacterium]